MSEDEKRRAKRHRLPPKRTQRARDLRSDMTYPERRLWSLLRKRQVDGMKFRRQHVVGPYVADYCRPALRLIVELDGLSHVGRAEYDQRRTDCLQQQGYRVIRVTNDDFLEDPAAVVDTIIATADEIRNG